jgi:hypothetical protein
MNGLSFIDVISKNAEPGGRDSRPFAASKFFTVTVREER